MVSPDGKHLYAAGEIDNAVAVFSVTSVASAFDLTAAIAAAGPGDTIDVPPGPHTVATELVIDKDLTLVGAGAANTVIQATESPGVAGHRVFSIASGTNVTISGVTIQHGDVTGNGGGYP